MRLIRSVFLNMTLEGESHFNQTQRMKMYIKVFFYHGSSALVILGFLHEIPRSHVNTQHSVRLDVHGSVHRNVNLIERTNKLQPYSIIYYSNVF